MQSISNVLPDNRTLQIVVAVVLLVALALILTVVYRLIFGHRLRVPHASRARQPRLGLVDAFSLDGQRQLVLVRRDNVEHLVMIGGPNDLLVESQIVRGAAVSSREPGLKPPAGSGQGLAIEPQHLGQGETASPRIDPPALRPSAVQPLRPAPRAAAALVRDPPTRLEPVIARAQPAPPRAEPRPEQRADPSPKRAAAPPPKPEVKPAPTPPPAAAAPPAAAPPAPTLPRTGPGLPPPIGAGATPPARGRATPLPPPLSAAGSSAPPAKPDATAPTLPASDAGAAGKPKGDDPFADLESLEAEMARLLGRSS